MVSTRRQLAKKVVSKKQSPKKTQSLKKTQSQKKTQSPKKTESPNTCMLCAGDDGKPFYICLCDCGLPTRINDPFMEHLIKQMDGER